MSRRRQRSGQTGMNGMNSCQAASIQKLKLVGAQKGQCISPLGRWIVYALGPRLAEGNSEGPGMALIDAIYDASSHTPR